MKAGTERKNAKKISLVLSSIDGQVQMALYMPILALVGAAFTDTNPALLSFSLTITSLVMVVFILITGKLAQYVDRRNLLIAGTMIFCVAGIAGAFAPNLATMFVFRAILGIGAGISYPLVPAIAAELFREQGERTQLMGYINSGASAIAFVLNLAAGVLGAINWRLCFWVYLILVPVIIMQLIYLPKVGKEKTRAGAKVDQVRIPRIIYLLCLGMFAFVAFGQVYNTSLALFVEWAKLGDSTTSGTAGAIQTMTSFFTGILLGRLVAKAGKYTPVLSVVAMCVCYILLAVAPAGWVVVLGLAFLGISCGSLFPYFNELVARYTPLSRMTMAMSLMACAMFIGLFLSAGVNTALLAAVGDNYRTMYMIIAILMGVAALITAIAMAARREKVAPLDPVIGAEAPDLMK